MAKDIQRAIEYYFAIEEEMQKRNSPFKPMIAFSGEKEYQGKVLTESSTMDFRHQK